MLLQGRTAVTQKQSDERKNPVPILYLFNINMPEQNQGTIVELSLDFEKQTVITQRSLKIYAKSQFARLRLMMVIPKQCKLR